METGTLKELNVKPGDVVRYGTKDWTYKIGSGPDEYEIKDLKSHLKRWSIVSRASDTPKTWGEMTDAEKGALLLAAHEGKVIEMWHNDGLGWRLPTVWGFWGKGAAYRVRPKSAPEAVAVVGYNDQYDGWVFCADEVPSIDTHRITFDTIDGKPVCDSIRMEAL